MSVRKPFLFELDDQSGIDPGAAAAPPDAPPEGRAMMRAVQVSRRRMSLSARLGLSALSGFVILAISVAAWDFVTGLVVRNAALGYLALGLLVVITVATLAFSLREWAGFRRLRQIDSLRMQAELARSTSDRAQSAQLMVALSELYAPRPEMRWPREHLAEMAPDQLDAQGLLDLTETVLLAPLDDAARREVEAAARQVALLTAMLPLALVDVLAALITNLRMIRRVAELYGGRAGTLGSLRLMRGVITHLLATGAVAVGEDMIGSVASGGLVSKLSRRFGEGIVNGALTARLGIAAIEVCRPLPFHALPRPRTSNIMSRALTGLFDRA
ncbi:MAG: TIGR01620 family protein [Rhodobacteraceae bacterium]|nr:MAG: TIGR01620 family protein [Paracoccaceae bacterium]